MEEWVRIRDLARKRVSVTEISRQTGRDRKTVQTVLQQPGPKPHGNTAKARASKLDPFRQYLLQRVKDGCLNATVLLDEIIPLGYAGRITILRDFLAPIRLELIRQREATERFETGPGKQAQVDWAQFGRIWDSQQECWRKLYVFIFTLGYSRALYVEFTTSCDMEHFLSCHLGAFTILGIPQQSLYDNLKTAILGHHPDGTPISPGRFLDFSLYYGFTPKFCQPYRARTKGKVERGIGYLRQNFWVRVAKEVATKQLDLAGLNERAREWVANVANVRVHGTHGEVVLKRFAEEEPLLGKMDGRPRYDTDYHSVRRVGSDGRLSYRGQLYQVGLSQALGEVQVDESLDGQVRIRGKEGQLLRAEVVVAARTQRKPSPQTIDEVGGQVGSLLRLVYGDEPQVQRRDLAVYEEVARAANVG